MKNKTVVTSLASEYVPNWKLPEAYRELLQNCIDRGGEITLEKSQLRMVNKNTVISPKSLFMGITEKWNDTDAIGQHGEGMKLAMLVLARQDVQFHIINGSSMWKPYLAENEWKVSVLHIDIMGDKATGSDFEILVDVPDYIDMGSIWLGVSRSEDLATDFILSEKRYAGKLFVKGLYVCPVNSKFGYNLTGLNLERDRSIANVYDLRGKVKAVWEKEVKAMPEKGTHIAKLLYESNNIESESFMYRETIPEINTACRKLLDKLHPNRHAVKEGYSVGNSGMAVSSGFAGGLGGAYFSSYTVKTDEEIWWEKYHKHLPDESLEELADFLGIDWK